MSLAVACMDTRAASAHHVQRSRGVGGLGYRSAETLGQVGDLLGPLIPGREEKGRGIFGLNGKSVMLDPEGERWLIAEHEPVEIDVSEWNEFAVIAQGNRLIHTINGQLSSELIDCHESGRSLQGLLAIQLHRGNPNRVEIKDLRIKNLPKGDILPFTSNVLPEGAKRIPKPRTSNPQGVGPVLKAN